MHDLAKIFGYSSFLTIMKSHRQPRCFMRFWFFVVKLHYNTGKIVSSPDHGNHCDIQQISMILPTFWTLPWYGNLLEVDFQPFGHFHGMEICWKSTFNLLDTSMVWKFVGSIMEICWKSWNFHYLERTRFFQCKVNERSLLQSHCFSVCKKFELRPGCIMVDYESLIV